MRSFNMECKNCTKILEVNDVDQIILRMGKGKDDGKKFYLVQCPVCKDKTEVPEWVNTYVDNEYIRAHLMIVVMDYQAAFV